MDYKQFDFYQKLKLQIGDWLKEQESGQFKWRDYVSVLPECFYFVSELATDNSLTIETKSKLAKAMAYVISPWDFLPEEEFGPAGYLDDLTVCAVILDGVLSEIEPDIWQKYWKGNRDLIELKNNVLKDSKEMLGESLLKKITDKFREER